MIVKKNSKTVRSSEFKKLSPGGESEYAKQVSLATRIKFRLTG